MNDNVNIIKYTKPYKYTEEYLATRTFSPSNGHQRMDSVNTGSPAKHGDQGESREVQEAGTRSRIPHGWQPLKKKASHQQLPAYGR